MTRPTSSASSQALSFVPAWTFDAFIYHIYPLGFLDAPRRNPQHGPPVHRLLALRQWYDHIAGLGVNTILFGPVFESSTHGYDTIDFKRVDRRLGDIETLRTVVDELHQRGMRVLLDGVFNHTGRHFFAFEDVQARGRRSQYRQWYRINLKRNNRYNDGFEYEGWHGSLSLPELNLQSEAVRQHLFDVARFWLEEIGIDGWRLDAAGDVSPAFWQAFRRACKEVKPDAFLFGELVFGEYDQYLGSKGLDGATHYPLYDAIVRSFDARRFGRLARLLRQHRQAPRPAALLSFLGNHDVTRLSTRLGDSNDFYPATLLLFTLPFIPCWYYGDECGMAGDKHAGDAALRQAMPGPNDAWPDGVSDRYQTVARLARLRQTHPVLRYGHIRFVRADRERLALVLVDDTTVALIAINASDQSQHWQFKVPDDTLPPGTTLHDTMRDDVPANTVSADGTVTLDPLEARWGRVLISARAAE